MSTARALFVLALSTAAVVTPAARAAAQDRVITFEFTPTRRAQVAIWVESSSGEFMRTVLLTAATAYRGIGNRPGASQMNSGFRWPYGRRENVLPIWGHRRLAAPGAEPFPRVIFQSRVEGFASRTTDDFSVDSYYCLSFDDDRSRREWLDAVSCASVFNSDKGRYLTEAEATRGYVEPFEEGGRAFMRQLDAGSLYPPRRDAERCADGGCYDHADVATFASRAREVMPEIDAVTRATFDGDVPVSLTWDVPEEWPAGEYAAFLEINVEGDYNDAWNDARYPTPRGPAGTWDYWALNFGYAYRGQPSIVYRVPFSIRASGMATTSEPHGYGSVDGTSGVISPMDPSISNDAMMAPGSGADRLRRRADGSLFGVNVVATNICGAPTPPPECGRACSAGSPCPTNFVCAPDSTCVGLCDIDMPPSAITGLSARTHSNEKHSHAWAHLTFTVPEGSRALSRYEVRVSTTPIVDRDSFMRAVPANAASADSVELRIPTTGRPGDVIDVDFGGLLPESHYWVGIRAVDLCNDASEIAVAEVTTTAIHFTTVTPCFVATATYGSPLAAEVGALRRLRDRHLLTNPAGRALVRAYYAVGPELAPLVANDTPLRDLTRAALAPLVALAELIGSVED